MARSLDVKLIESFAALASLGGTAMPPQPGRDDWQALRAFSNASVAAIESSLPEHARVRRLEVNIRSYDDAEITARWYQAAETGPGSAVVYFHGGGMVAGSVKLYDRLVAAYTAESGVPILSVDYRLAPEYQHPTPVEDCFAALAWLSATGPDVGVDPARVGLMGDSAGGGLAAATAILARDRGLPLSCQLLIYPMLDDRTTTPDDLLVPFGSWTYDNNYTGWHALLGDKIGTDDVPPSAAPARLLDMSGLAAAYVEVGDLDILRNESIEYAQRLSGAGAAVELHVHPGCPHGFDRADRRVEVVRRAWDDRIRVLRAL